MTKVLPLAILAGFFAFLPAHSLPLNHQTAIGHLNPAAISTSNTYLLDQSSTLLDEKRYSEAIPILEKVVDNDPINIFGWYNLGFSYHELAKQSRDTQQADMLTAKAEYAFLRVQNLNPELEAPYYKLGKIALTQNDIEKAKQYYVMAVEEHPEHAAFRFNLARVYDQSQQYDQAIHHYEKTIALDPEFIYAYNNLGLLYEAHKRTADAEKVYKEALKRDKTYNFARLNLGNLYAEANRYDDAKTAYLEALNYEPDNAWGHLYLGNVYFITEQYEAAAREYRLSVQHNPDYTTTYYLLAMSLTKLRQLDEALSIGMHYMTMDPDGAYAGEMKALITALKLKKAGLDASGR